MGPPFKSVKTILRFFSRKNQAAINQVEQDVKDKVRKQMEDESEERAAEMLPGRVLSLLIDPCLMETMSFPHPYGRKSFHKTIPTVLADLVRKIIADLGVVVDDNLEKRIRVI